MLGTYRKTSKNGMDRFQTRCRKCVYKTKWMSEKHAESSGVQHAQMKHLETLPTVERHYEE